MRDTYICVRACVRLGVRAVRALRRRRCTFSDCTKRASVTLSYRCGGLSFEGRSCAQHAMYMAYCLREARRGPGDRGREVDDG